VTYFVSLSWKQSVSIVEELRRTIWGKEYLENKRELIIVKKSLKDFSCAG
jgi:hypothetical protein